MRSDFRDTSSQSQENLRKNLYRFSIWEFWMCAKSPVLGDLIALWKNETSRYHNGLE
jgi:hypothetical protein